MVYEVDCKNKKVQVETYYNSPFFRCTYNGMEFRSIKSDNDALYAMLEYLKHRFKLTYTPTHRRIR